MKVRVLQWNIGGGYRRKKESNAEEVSSYSISDIDYVAKEISKHNPDIIFLQETHATENDSQAKYISEKLGYKNFINDIYDHSHVEDGQELGQCIISKFPLSGCRFDFFVNPRLEMISIGGEKWISHNKGISMCYADFGGGKKICLKTLHSFPFRKFGVNPINELSEIIRDIEDKMIGDSKNNAEIIAGDFNLDSANLKTFFPRIFSNGFSEFVLENPTTPKGRKYDHIIYKNINHKNTWVIDDVLTDHYSVVSEFEL